MIRRGLFHCAVLFLLLIFSAGCATTKVRNDVKIIEAKTSDEKFAVSFAFVQKIEISPESSKDLYLPFNDPQLLERVKKTRSLQLRIWISNPERLNYELRQTICSAEPITKCAEKRIYEGSGTQEAFQLEAPFSEPGSTKLIRALLLDKRLPFPSLIIGDGIYIIPKQNQKDKKGGDQG